MMLKISHILVIVFSLTLNNLAVAEDMPTADEVAAQQAAFSKMMDAVPGKVTPSPRIGSKLNKGTPSSLKIDPSEMAARMANAAVRVKGNDLMVFISLTMPPEIIKQLAEQAKERGATIMLRGFVGDSLQKTQNIAASLNKAGAVWQINPEAFKVFRVTNVPTFVIATNVAGSILEEGCAKPASYVSVNGNQSLDVALQTIRRHSKTKSFADEADARLRSTN